MYLRYAAAVKKHQPRPSEFFTFCRYVLVGCLPGLLPFQSPCQACHPRRVCGWCTRGAVANWPSWPGRAAWFHVDFPRPGFPWTPVQAPAPLALRGTWVQGYRGTGVLGARGVALRCVALRRVNVSVCPVNRAVVPLEVEQRCWRLPGPAAS